jgi:F420-0:gamma-glutamyl ligase|uniref:Coenzyme F420:L-glutamate ligase-like domain-containing protein n=1 Tax=candidate division WOR-3 bacterium TaxID=2052148 RepID=A0A7C6EAP5_UNCW3
MRIKEPVVQFEGKRFQRIWVKTHIINDQDDIINVVEKYTKDILKDNDIITIAESVVAITQGRAIPITKIKPSLLARILWRFVRKVPYGIGLRSPFSMECAIQEVGKGRILLAAFVGAVGKFLGRRGDFYRVAGKQAAMIDACHTSGVKDFYECVIMGPKDPEIVAQKIKERIHHPVAIVDANDISGCWVVGASDGVEKKLVEAVMADNPAGQDDSLTPIIIIRKIE